MFIFFSKKIHLPSFITSSVKTTIVALAFISLGVNIANIVDSADSVNSRSHGLYGSKSADCYATVPVMFFLLLASNSVTLKSTFTIPFMLFSRTIRNCNLSEDIMRDLQQLLSRHHQYAHVHEQGTRASCCCRRRWTRQRFVAPLCRQGMDVLPLCAVVSTEPVPYRTG